MDPAELDPGSVCPPWEDDVTRGSFACTSARSRRGSLAALRASHESKTDRGREKPDQRPDQARRQRRENRKPYGADDQTRRGAHRRADRGVRERSPERNPSLAPVNFNQSKPGEKYFTVWYAGPLSIRNDRGLFQFIPSNLLRFTAHAGSADLGVAPNPSLPDFHRDVQFTVNGQFQPVIKSKAGQTEIWVLCNISDFAYMNVQLTETASGRHPKIAIVGQDGNPYPAVHYPVTDNGTRLLIPPASRFAIAVTIPTEGELVLEMPSRGGGAKTITAPGVLYTNNGTDNPRPYLAA